MCLLVGDFVVHQIVSSGSLDLGDFGPLGLLIDYMSYCAGHYNLGIKASRLIYFVSGHLHGSLVVSVRSVQSAFLFDMKIVATSYSQVIAVVVLNSYLDSLCAI